MTEQEIRAQLLYVAKLSALGVLVDLFGLIILAWQHALISSVMGMAAALLLMIGNLLVITYRFASYPAPPRVPSGRSQWAGPM